MQIVSKVPVVKKCAKCNTVLYKCAPEQCIIIQAVFLAVTCQSQKAFVLGTIYYLYFSHLDVTAFCCVARLNVSNLKVNITEEFQASQLPGGQFSSMGIRKKVISYQQWPSGLRRHCLADLKRSRQQFEPCHCQILLFIIIQIKLWWTNSVGLILQSLFVGIPQSTQTLIYVQIWLT